MPNPSRSCMHKKIYTDIRHYFLLFPPRPPSWLEPRLPLGLRPSLEYEGLRPRPSFLFFLRRPEEEASDTDPGADPLPLSSFRRMFFLAFDLPFLEGGDAEEQEDRLLLLPRLLSLL